MQKLAGWGLGEVADSGQSPGCLSSGDLLGLNQFLDEHNGGVAAGLDEAVDEQGPEKYKSFVN